MEVRHLTHLACLFVACLVPFLPLEAVEISNRDGQVIEVDILEIEPSKIEIKLANGHVMWLERSRLSEATESMLESLEAKEAEAYKALNETLGIPLFVDQNLWDDPADELAKRLGWKQESKTESQSSYRSYPGENDRILQSRPYSAALYGGSGTVERLSIIFANKGDFPASGLASRDKIEAIENAIKADAERIERLLTGQLGKPDRQRLGRGRSLRQRVHRWDWNSHAFLLASEVGEYVTLRITPTDLADNKGRAERLSDAALREQSKANLKTHENGDVILQNIPMVNQGPKGYCVPATFERYLRYLSIPADMYVLAMAGQTNVGGGTSLLNMMTALESYAASQNRKLRQDETTIDVRSVAKYIDNGLPLIWTMFSSKEYNTFVNQRTVERGKQNDWRAWKDRTRKEARRIELRKDRMAAHACMIIGYNKETDEIAVSDSWGPRYELRWVPAEQAEQVSQGSIYLVDY
ncbi:MAG: hypothetical protein GVY36_04315 [Verrucomicrobia bacterium]|jgi:hypothetical protein|nr:hypothetical protein [Verrucomicrobiota bacterium]